MKTLVIAPHADDEVLGCGGTLLRRKAEGAQLAWLLVTGIFEQYGWPADAVKKRELEMSKVAKLIGFDEVFSLKLPSTQLDRLPMNELIGKFSDIFGVFNPSEVFIPHLSDAHTDHRVVFDVAAACVKSFRNSSVERVLAYETLSDTGFGLDDRAPFKPNCFIDISAYVEKKLELMAVYESEMASFPFPRSVEAIRAQAMFRGSMAGFKAAEAFQLLRERF